MCRDSLDELACASELHRRNLTSGRHALQACVHCERGGARRPRWAKAAASAASIRAARHVRASCALPWRRSTASRAPCATRGRDPRPARCAPWSR